jgi:hypothetical protein
MKIKLLILAAVLSSQGIFAMGPLEKPVVNPSMIPEAAAVCTENGCWNAGVCGAIEECAVEEVFQQAESLMCSAAPHIPGQTGILTTAADTALHTLQDSAATPGLQEQATAMLYSLLEYAQATDNTYLGGYLQQGLGYVQHGLGMAQELCYEYPQTAVAIGTIAGCYLLSKALVHAKKSLSARCKRAACDSTRPTRSSRARSGTVGGSNEDEDADNEGGSGEDDKVETTQAPDKGTRGDGSGGKKKRTRRRG